MTRGVNDEPLTVNCSVGAKNAHGRACVDDHLDACLAAGINVEGINAEVAAGQWEFQVFAKSARRAGDETWIARYLLERTGENYGFGIEWHPKPFGDLDWNGPGVFVGVFEETLNNLEIGEISEPFKSEFGWHIVEVLERRVHDTTEDVKRQQAMMAIRDSKVAEETELWLRQMRDESFVEYRL